MPEKITIIKTLNKGDQPILISRINSHHKRYVIDKRSKDPCTQTIEIIKLTAEDNSLQQGREK